MTEEFVRVARNWSAVRSEAGCGRTNYLHWSWVGIPGKRNLSRYWWEARVRELRNLLVKGLLCLCLLPEVAAAAVLSILFVLPGKFARKETCFLAKVRLKVRL